MSLLLSSEMALLILTIVHMALPYFAYAFIVRKAAVVRTCDCVYFFVVLDYVCVIRHCDIARFSFIRAPC